MTDEQKLSLAIQREVGANDMRTLALNSLRLRFMDMFNYHGSINPDARDAYIDSLIIASIPDEPLSHTT